MTEKVMLVGKRAALVGGRHGVFLVNRFDIYVGQAMMAYGEYCEAESEMLCRLIRPGETVIEVGANMGTHTVALAKAANPGTVFAMEPQPEMFNLLCANVSLNGLDNVRPIQAAVGRESGTLSVPKVDYGAEGNFGGIEMKMDGDFEIPVIRLADLGVKGSVGLIKVDVEGMEGEVIAGAQTLIAQYRPILYVENDRSKKSPELISTIKGFNYDLWWHLPLLFNPNNFLGNAENRYGHVVSCNMICIPSERGASMEGLVRIKNPAVHPFPEKN